MEQRDPIEDDRRSEAQSEATMEERPDPIAPEKDRWATIRENAARRAARASEEQSESRPSQSARTEDGETSGEESECCPSHIYEACINANKSQPSSPASPESKLAWLS